MRTGEIDTGGEKRLFGVVFRLRLPVRAIKEERYNFLKHFLSDVHRAVDAIGWLDPIHFAHSDLPRHGFSSVTKLDVEQVAAQDNSHAMKGIAMPECRLARRQPLPPHQVVAAMMQDLLIWRWFHT
jgi:hypothetical protein